MNDLDIIARCTRNGVTAWQSVAVQLGRPVDSVRAQFDPGYARAYVWAPSREPIPEPPIDLNDVTSLTKRDSLRVRILIFLAKQTASAQTLACALNAKVTSVKVELSEQKRGGLVKHDARYPYTWSLTEQGAVAVAEHRRGNAKVAGEAA